MFNRNCIAPRVKPDYFIIIGVCDDLVYTIERTESFDCKAPKSSKKLYTQLNDILNQAINFLNYKK